MLRLAQAHDADVPAQIRVVNDQFSCPTYAGDLAQVLLTWFRQAEHRLACCITAARIPCHGTISRSAYSIAPAPWTTLFACRRCRPLPLLPTLVWPRGRLTRRYRAQVSKRWASGASTCVKIGRAHV